MGADSYFSSFVFGAIVLALTAKIYQVSRSRGSNPYPPGPPGTFLIGNLRDMPSSHNWLTFTEWGRKYGPLTYLNAAGQPFLIINSHDTAMDLLEKTIYSGRPRLVMASELCGLSGYTALINYGPEFRKHRKLLAQALNPRVVQKEFVPLQTRIAKLFVKRMLDAPGSFADHIAYVAAEVLQIFTYGSCTDGDLDLVGLSAQANEIFSRTLAGYAVDFLPWMKYIPSWFPGAQFQRDAIAWRAVAERSIRLPFDMVKRQKALGELTQVSFTSLLLDDNEAKGGGLEEEELIASVSAMLLHAGGDTTSTILLTFMLAMKLYPDVQAKAQAEIDRVVGSDRFPTMADKESLPYLNAVLLETLRWHSPAPAGIPHRLMEDDVYNGYRIPAGTIVLVNLWGILHDERYFSDPFTFNPDRFLPRAQEHTHNWSASCLIDPMAVSFGYGRRICPAIGVAETGLWIFMSMILSSFDITEKTDASENKEPITVRSPPAFTGGLNSNPEPFECNITPRSMERARLIKEATSGV